MTSDALKELVVTFNPPLYLQRRGWVFDILRRERVREVLDVGCGEGELISCLCNPAPWLPPPPASVLDPCAMLPQSDEAGESPLVLPQMDPADGFMHPVSVHGLDVSADDLKLAAEDTAPRRLSVLPGDMQEGLARWEPLEVNIWEGGLERINPAFVGVECIVSTEVIEHLPEDVLPDFAPILLGAYHPRLLLITTPSYTFNARFTAPDAPPGARSGFPDQTGRTTRIFRHHDHKFEWTVEEFRGWCQSVAEEWGYDVDVGGVGKAEETDNWGRDAELGWASQVAAFTRRDGTDNTQARERHCSDSGILLRAKKREQHTLLATHLHMPHEKAQQPGSLEDIGDLVKFKMCHFRETVMSIWDLWVESGVAILCGGWMELLAYAVEQHPDIRLHRSQENPLNKWEIELLCSLPPTQDTCDQDAPNCNDSLGRESDDDDAAVEETHSPVPGWNDETWGTASWGTDDEWGVATIPSTSWSLTSDDWGASTNSVLSAGSGWV